MRNFKICIPLMVSFLLLGCSTVRVSYDYDTSVDFSAMRTFAWQKDTQAKTGDIRIDDPFLDQRIRTAVEQALQSNGYQKTDRSSADFLIGYQVGIQQKIKSDDFQTGIGYGVGRRGRYGTIGIRSGVQVQSYDEGMLIIDVLDPENNALLWRGKGTDTLSDHGGQEEKTKKINEAVEKILTQFPPPAR